MLSILMTLVVIGLIYYLITLLPLPEPFPLIIRVLLIIFLIIWLFQFLKGGPALF